jgi:uncharacterized delta-60 repeat protein
MIKAGFLAGLVMGCLAIAPSMAAGHTGVPPSDAHAPGDVDPIVPTLHSAVFKEPDKIDRFPVHDCSDPQKKCTWERTFGRALPDKAYDVAALPDGGMVAVGHTRAVKGSGHDLLVVRLGRAGEILWDRTLGGLREDHGYGVVTGHNDEIVVAGNTRSKGSGKSDLWVLQLKPDGSVGWEQTFGGKLDDRARTIAAMDGGGYVVAGTTQSGGAPEGDAWVIKLDENGQRVWDRTFGGNREDGIFQVRTHRDGSIMATGYTDVGGSAGFDLWVLKLDGSGSLVWERNFGKSVFDSGTAIQPTPDGGCLVAGITSEHGYHNDQAWLLRLAPDGHRVWDRTLGGDRTDNAWAIVKTGVSRYIVVVATSSFGAGSVDAWLICFDLQGDQKWARLYGGELWDRPTAATLTEDGGLFIGGYTTTRGAGYEDFWLLRLEADGRF